jgi:hypothetical protein
MSAISTDRLGAGQAPVSQREPFGAAQDIGREMAEDEQALRDVRRRFEQTEDQHERGELAAEALDHVERQLNRARERRRQLDGAEGKLWARRNRLERFLIQAHGDGWWRERQSRQPPVASRAD